MQRRLLRRRLRRNLRKLAGFSGQSEHLVDEYILKRFGHLSAARRFVIGWVALMLLLIGGLLTQNLLLSSHYQTVRAVPGGIYKEGMLGSFTNANPIYAVNGADAAVSRLLFAGLFTHDEDGRLVGDLASGYQVDSRGTTYTVNLRPNLRWQDGRPLTSADVAFTYRAIQNPDAKSPLQASWRDIDISTPDSHTVVFKLPGALAPFADNLTTGIVPEHLLKNVAAADLRSADFNTVHPVGAGPFSWRGIEINSTDPTNAEQQIALLPFAAYHAGQPKLQEFVIHTYSSPKHLLNDFRDQQLTAALGFDELPKALEDDHDVEIHNFLLRAITMTFFKTTSGVLADQKVRTGLVQASDVPAIVNQLGYPTRIVRSPFLPNQPGYDSKLLQAGHDLKAAKDTLTADGWVPGKNGIRNKSGARLAFTLTAADTAESRKVTRLLRSQWRTAGADVQVQLLDPAEFQTTLSAHAYDAVLYGISIGVDPDVFVYWHSSQADVRSAERLNFSEYKNSSADLSLEAGRSRLDPELRAVKYHPFLQDWVQDNPALALYQPRVLYLTNGVVSGLDDFALTNPAGRYVNVQNWEIRQARVTN